MDAHSGRRLICSVIAIAATLLAPASMLAHGDEPGWRSEAHQPEQESFLPYVMQVLEIARAQSGYAGEWYDAAEPSLTVYGKAEATAAFDAIAAEAPAGFRVTWSRSDYSMADLDALAESISREDIDVESVEYDYDGSGLVVNYAATEGKSAIAAWEKSQKQGSSRAVSPPVSWVPVAAGSVRPADTRNSDTAPFAGGLRIGSSAGGCTGGFPVTRSNGEVGIVTAWHCSDGAVGLSWKAQGSGAAVGKSSAARSRAWDVQFIKSSSGRIENKIFYGGYKTGSKKAIPSFAYLDQYLPAGTDIVVSGGYSGNQAGVITGLVNDLDYNGGGDQAGKKYYQVEAAGNNPIAGNGDSGSPVVTVDGGEAFPVGLFVAGSGPDIPCKGVPSSSTRTCSKVGYVTPMHKMYAVID